MSTVDAPPGAPSTALPRPFFITGGTVPADAASYITRRADGDLLGGLLTGDYCYVLNTRQMGKSSLSVQAIARLRERGVRTVFIDLTKIGAHNVSAEQWYAGLVSETGRQVGLRAEFLRHWKENAAQTPVSRFFGALRDVALTPDTSPLVVFIDEIDAVRSLPFSTDEFFAAVRQCYNARPLEPALSRLTFCLIGVAEPADLIADPRLSPFNIGRRIRLEDFTDHEAAPLAAHLPGGRAVLDRALYWTGGHPYLTQRLCREAAEQDAQTPGDVDRLCDALFLSRSARESDDNLAFVRSRLLRAETDVPALLHLYDQVRAGRRRVRDDETDPLCSVLRLSGVCKPLGDRLVVRNRIYDHVFDAAWVRDNMPGAEVRRQREAYRRGVMRTSLLSGSVAALLGWMAFSSMSSARRADESAENARREALRAIKDESRTHSLLAAAQLREREVERARIAARKETARAAAEIAAARREAQRARRGEAEARRALDRALERQAELEAALRAYRASAR
jgi:hypothetical protein